MPDWSRYVRERLQLPPLSRHLDDSVFKEIAAQLEDCYQDHIARGATAKEAESATLDHINDWDLLASEISDAHGQRRSEMADNWIEGREIEFRKRGRIPFLLADLSRDIRLALRMMTRKPGFTVLAITSLAVGLGAATAIFSLMNATLFKVPPIEEPDQVVELFNGEFGNHSYLDYLILKEECAPFLELAARDEFWFADFASDPLFLRNDSLTTQIDLGLVSGNYFSMLGLDPFAGRLLAPEDNRVAGGNHVAVLSWPFWNQTMNGDRGIIGETIDLSGTSYEVIGIAPEGFRGSTFTSNVDIWIPVVMRRAIEPPERVEDIVQSDWSWIHILGRLGPGVTIDQARARINAIVAGSDRIRETLQERTVTIQPLRKSTIIPTLRERTVAYLMMLLLAAGLVALVACVNLSNLFAGRMDERRTEFSIRHALGAGKGTLIRQYLVESGVIAVLGGVGAIIFSIWLDGILFSMLAPGMNLSASVISVDPDLRVLGFTFGLVVLSSTAIGLIPALRDRSGNITASLKPGPGTADTRYRFLNLQNVLVMSQITLSMVLLVGSGLMIRTISNLQNQDPGFSTRNMMTISIDNERMPLDEQSGALLYRTIVDQVRVLPGIESASLAKVGPLSGITWGGIMHFEGYEPGPEDRSHAAENFVDPGFFQMMGIQLLRGRGFSEQDIPGSEKVVIVNQTLVEMYWPDSEPLGKTVRWWAEDGDGETYRVIGVVNDHFYSHMRRGVVPLTYYPLSQHFLKNPVLLTRTMSDPYQMVSTISSTIREVSPSLNLFNQTSIEDQIHDQGSRDRGTMIMLLSCASLALLLSVLGTYGVMSGMVTRRRQEIGIRIALGARREEVIGFVLARGMRLVITALAVGVILSLGATTIMRSQVFGISTADPVTYLTVALILAGAGFLACLVPARRVVKIDPIESLRAE